MAEIIPTGEHKAIKLDVWHSEQILAADKLAKKLRDDPENGGFAKFTFWLKKGVFDLVESYREACGIGISETTSLRPKKKLPTTT